MGHGTGVLRALLAWYGIRGLTVGVAGTCSLFISQKSGVPQHHLVGARGVGLTVGPALLGSAVGRVIWSGNSQVGVAAALAGKMACELLIPRTSDPALLYLAFFGVGIAVALLDTFSTVLLSKAHGRRMGTMLVAYDTFYGLGCMVAPFVAVLNPERAWNLLALMDLLLGLVLVGKRLISGKPSNWKAKIRGPGGQSGAGDAEAAETVARPPARVIRVGMAFTFMVQLTMTAVSCWGFTYASAALGVPPSLAAMIPGSFYAACTGARMCITPATMRFKPSAIIHMGVVLTVVAAGAFYVLDSSLTAALAAGTGSEVAVAHMPWLVACFVVMGAGFSPHYSLMLAAIQEHGELAAQQHGWYGTSTSLGITMGMWLPGIVRLPIIELVGSTCLFLMINGYARDFPRGFEAAGSLGAVKSAGP